MAYWSPYDNNGGTVVAVAGKDFAVIAGDTRLSTGYSILTRHKSKLYEIDSNCVLASSGFQADIRTLQKNLQARHYMYLQQHNEKMSCEAMAQLLSNTLYYKRFFPYYTFNLLAGLDAKGKGCVFGYDAVGSMQRVGYGVQGTAKELVMPVLDNQIKSGNPLAIPIQDYNTRLSAEETVELVKDAFASAAERDIYTGDELEILVITASGIAKEVLPLRRD